MIIPSKLGVLREKRHPKRRFQANERGAFCKHFIDCILFKESFYKKKEQTKFMNSAWILVKKQTQQNRPSSTSYMFIIWITAAIIFLLSIFVDKSTASEDMYAPYLLIINLRHLFLMVIYFFFLSNVLCLWFVML